MDKPRPISPTDLYLELGTAGAPALIDVRTGPTFDADDRLIIGARRLPESPDQWKIELKKANALWCMAVISYDSKETRGLL